MSRFPDAFLSDVRDRHDVVDLVGRYVQLKKAGANYSGLCPFHSEKSPSFSVSPTKQFYHCFGCGAHGDVFGFLMAHTGMTFVEAVEELAQAAGMPLPERAKPTPEVQAREAHESSLYEVLSRAARHFHLNLRQEPETIDYMKRRGLTKETVVKFSLGHASNGLRAALADVPESVLVEAGLVSRSEETGHVRDKFRERLMFPIWNAAGQVIGFGGRTMTDAEPKYLNSPETPVFHKGEELYGLNFARAAVRQTRSAVVVEGYMDVAMLHQHGETRAVAALGTSITAEQVTRLLRQCQSIYFCFDGDKAGQHAADRAANIVLSVMTDGKRAYFLTLPNDHDPDSYVREHGIDAWREALINASVPLSERVIAILHGGIRKVHAEDRAAMAKEASMLLATIEHAPLFRDALRGEIEAAIGVEVSVAPRATKGSARMQGGQVDAQRAPVTNERQLFYRRLALLSAIDVNRTCEVPQELRDEFSELIVGWFGVNAPEQRFVAAERIPDVALRMAVTEALASHADRERIVASAGLVHEANAILSTIASDLEQRNRAQAAAALFS
ncbi:DNA primase [Ralstonia sp. ASV6]|uniref:DNA primase n=1 Tax=Ralstonia sp. ASV6 TaxID=2795124 RepID=UPI0018ED8EF9